MNDPTLFDAVSPKITPCWAMVNPTRISIFMQRRTDSTYVFVRLGGLDEIVQLEGMQESKFTGNSSLFE